MGWMPSPRGLKSPEVRGLRGVTDKPLGPEIQALS